MELFILLILVSCIPGGIAASKGRNFFLWWFYGMMINLIAIPHALLLKPNENADGYRKCDQCSEVIKEEAKVCKYCGNAQ